MTKKKVLFIYNGGTIGQVPENRDGRMILVPPKDSKIFQEACEPISKQPPIRDWGIPL